MLHLRPHDARPLGPEVQQAVFIFILIMKMNMTASQCLRLQGDWALRAQGTVMKTMTKGGPPAK